MDGVLVVTLRGGLLLYQRTFTANFGLPRPTHPMNLASFFFALQSNAAAIYEEEDAEDGDFEARAVSPAGSGAPSPQRRAASLTWTAR